MNGLKVSLAEVTECANQIRICNEHMYDLLNQMKKEMTDTNVSWISEGGEAIRNRFTQFSSRFATQKETMDSYAKFLDMTVASYDTLETTITGNASNMQS